MMEDRAATMCCCYRSIFNTVGTTDGQIGDPWGLTVVNSILPLWFDVHVVNTPFAFAYAK